MAKGKWFKKGAECWVYSTLEIPDDPTHKHWACRGKIISIRNRMTYVLLDFSKRAVGKFGFTEDTLATPFFTDTEVFYSLGMIRRRYGNNFEIRDEKWS